MHGSDADCRDFAVRTVHLNPVARLVNVFDDRHDPSYHAARVILESEGECETYSCGQGYYLLESRFNQKWDDYRDAGNPDQQSGDRGYPQDQQALVRGRFS